MVHLRWGILALCLLIVTSCTVLCTHIDKPGGDDSNGHCSICLTVAGHRAIIQAVVVTHVSPDLVVTELTAHSDQIIKQDRFASSLYIRPPPLS